MSHNKHRFFTQPIAADATHAELLDSEAHHAMHVLRLKPGEGVTLFDGSGFQWDATIETVTRRSVSLRLDGRHYVDRERPADLILAVAWPKGERQKWMIEKLTELGVTRLLPLIADHSSVIPTAQSKEKWLANVIAASKQCGRNVLMDIQPPMPALEVLTSSQLPKIRYFLDASDSAGQLSSPPVVGAAHDSGVTAQLDQPVIAMIGPEGGWSATERNAAVSNGWHIASLGPRTLRIETAAIAIAAILAFGNDLQIKSERRQPSGN